ncbi:HAAS signaling domain-containing protein [Levilactobacillus sp. N40-8-2]|uniref:HAAS signaling domain-containing protein n=1 Tax=Levilactobacillus muriae TaxID=3238987 RepID=UPI0038B3C850
MNDYIQAIERLLGQLTTAEQQDVAEYYREYLLDAGIETYQQAVDELGNAQVVSTQSLSGLFDSNE